MANKSVSFEIPASELAPPGISGDLVIVGSAEPLTAKESRRRRDDRDLRPFRVHCVFARDSGFARSIESHLQPEDGTSFFKPPDGCATVAVITPVGRCDFHTNASGEIAGASAQILARTPQQARREFLDLVIPFLDRLSFLANAPIAVSTVVCADERNQVQVIGYTAPYQDVVVNPSEGLVRAEMRPIYALYREAKNSVSPFYRFLCYYKILEGIFRHLRPAVRERAKSSGISLRWTKELIPDHPELRKFDDSLVGRSITDYFDNVLQKQFRDKVAHYILDSGELLNPSDSGADAAFANVTLVVELACRVVVEQQERYYEQVAAGPTAPAGTAEPTT